VVKSMQRQKAAEAGREAEGEMEGRGSQGEGSDALCAQAA